MFVDVFVIQSQKEKKMKKVAVVARSFQAGSGVGGKEFDKEAFAKKVAKPIRDLLGYKNVGTIIVLTNGQSGHKLAEIVTNDKTPTILALEETFSEEIENGRLLPYVCANWGNNPGSGEALNQGAKLAQEMGYEWCLNWSPEIEMDGFFIHEALIWAEQRELSVIGALRQSWWEKPQWKVAQNTAALWRLDALLSVEGFSPECNGTGETVNTPEFGEVPLAGMEDFHAMLRIMKADPKFRWGMIKRPTPLSWDTNFEPDSEREQNHLKKVARQYLVMQTYVKKVFPDKSFNKVMDEFFARMHLA